MNIPAVNTRWPAALLAGLAALPVQADSERMETLVVRAAREPIPANSSGNAVSVLNEALLDSRQTASLAEILRSVPGAAVSRSGVLGSQTQLRLRGAESNHVLVFIDGVRANDPSQNGEFNFAHLLNADIESVEVIRGPQSALWGSDALSGVVNVTTRRATGGASGGVYAEGGSDDWRHAGANGGVGGRDYSAGFSVSQLETDGDNISRSGSEEDGYENTTANGRLEYRFSDAVSLEANLRYVDSHTEFDRVDFGTGLPVDSADETDSEQLYGRAAMNLDSPGGRWRNTLAWTLTDVDNRNRTENPFSAAGFDHYTSKAEVQVWTLQSSFDIRQGHTLTGAWERLEEDFRQRGPVGFGDPNRDERMDTDSLILEYRAEFEAGVSLRGSARHDDNSDFDDKTTGRITAAWPLANGTTTLRAGWGTGIKNPTFTERFGFFINFIGNPDLKPEESRGWEAGLDQHLFGDRLRLAATWFDEQLEDEINGFVFDPDSGGFTAGNEDGKSRREGLELSASWDITANLRLYGAYSWLDASEDTPSGQVDEIRRPEHLASLNLDWRFLADRANLNLNIDYSGKQDDIFFPPAPPYQQRVELDAFTLVTVAASYRLSGNFEAFARVENALDESYEEVFGFRAAGRGVFAGLRYTFGN